MKNRIITFICFLVLLTPLQAQEKSLTSGMKRLIGCWNDSQSKAWKYGFFEKFVIYDNDFWDYQSVDCSKDKAAIVLKKGNELLKLKLTFDKTSDSICNITSSKEGKSKLRLHSVIPDFAGADHSMFTDNGYKWDSVTIIGYMRNIQRKIQFKISVPNFFSEDESDYYADVDSLGRFRITVPIINISEIFLDWREGGMYVPTLVEPNEKFFLYYDYANKETRFMGTNSRLKQEQVNYDKFLARRQWSKHLSYDAKMEHDAYLSEQQKLYNEQKELFTNYLTMHPHISDKFKFYQEKQILMRHACNLMQRRFKLRRNFDKEQLSKTYMDYVVQIYKQIPTPYSLCRDTYVFLTDYFDYYNNLLTNNVTFSNIEVLKYLDKENIHKLTDQQKADLKDYEKVISTTVMGQEFKIDSLRVKEIVAPYKEAVTRAGQFLNDTTTLKLVEKHTSIMPALMEMKRIDNEMICFDSIPVSPILQELIATQAVCHLLYHSKTALTEQCIDYFKSLVNNENFQKVVLSQQEEYIRLANQELGNTESLKKAEHLKGIKNADELLDRLISPYKGKVIFIDIWGTWCSPCKKEMKYAPAIKEALKDKEVVFMYFANNSPEDSWKNVVKENQLTGSNIIHYNLPDEQEKMLEQLFSVKFFPTFILIDKEGNITDRNAPPPSRKEMLLNKINGLLAK